MRSISSGRPTFDVKIKNRKKDKAITKLNAYTKSPNVEFNIDDFEHYALSRLNGIVID